MMAIFKRYNPLFSSSSTLFSRLQALILEQKRWTHASSGESAAGEVREVSSGFRLREGSIDTSTWRTVDSRTFGIRRSAISSPIWTVLKILQGQGFEAYLVGGCVRDLILGRTPKDFDVVTTATLEQIKNQFRRSTIIGRRFPICLVHIFSTKIEVSSFETTHKDAQHGQMILFSQMPNSCDKKDFVRWKDCMRRDFTINGLFYDPFVNTIYDYADGIRDVMASEVRTVIPAHLSFTEDCARILRGLRIVARLGLRFSEDTATAIQDLYSSIITLDKPRLMMELNFMLAYGAAVPSIRLLQKYKLLDILLPIQAAYLADQSKQLAGGSSIMLMELFSHVDKLLAADHPSDCSLWLGLLAFHLALVNQPQHAIVIWTFASVLYLGTWDRGIKFVRENVKRHVQFVPEIEEASGTKSDELLLEQTSHLASLVKASVNALVDPEALQESLVKYKTTLSSSNLDHLIFVSERSARNVLRVFDGLESDIQCYAKERSSFSINYDLLKRGDSDETRFVLGKVIFDAFNSKRALQEDQNPGKHKSNGEVIHQNNQNTSIYTSIDEPVQWKNQNARRRKRRKNREPRMPTYKINAVVDEFNGERIHQRNSNTNTVKGKKRRALSTLFE